MKKKMTEAEAARAREERIAAVAKNLKMQIIAMDNKKNELFQKVLEAHQKGLKAQEEQARGLMRKCMASQRQASGMLMTLELAVQSRDLAELNRQFLECIGTLSQDMTVSAKKTNVKKTEKQYLKAMYAAGQQTKDIDRMLELGQYSTIASADQESFTEFDAEIDGMLDMAGVPSFNVGTSKIK